MEFDAGSQSSSHLPPSLTQSAIMDFDPGPQWDPDAVTLESDPLDHVHKYMLPEPNLMPPMPESTEEHLMQIAQQLFALGFSVEAYVSRSRTVLPELNPIVWKFFHEVVLLLPRTLNKDHIEEARIDLYQELYRTERHKAMKVTELVNPGASLPEPLTMEAEGGQASVVAIEPEHEGNPFTDSPWSLTQNALATTDGVEYTLEFIPDEIPEPEVDAVDDPIPSAPATKAKSAAKGKAPAKKAAAKKAPAKKTAAKKAPPAKKSAAAAAPSKARASETAARGASARRAAKARASPAPRPLSPFYDDDEPFTLGVSNHLTGDVIIKFPPSLDPPKPIPFEFHGGKADPRFRRQEFAPAVHAPPAPPEQRASVREVTRSRTRVVKMDDPPPPPPAAGPSKKRGRAADDAEEPPAQKKVRRVAEKKAKVVEPPVVGTRRSSRNKGT
ncbi:hypothetical protein C8R44DRAFT_982314 [Mycena epipterygia]|nr:hypothetical protein C8R44DRAFT_982314 [Mycena epipterygia]